MASTGEKLLPEEKPEGGPVTPGGVWGSPAGARGCGVLGTNAVWLSWGAGGSAWGGSRSLNVSLGCREEGVCMKRLLISLVT